MAWSVLSTKTVTKERAVYLAIGMRTTNEVMKMNEEHIKGVINPAFSDFVWEIMNNPKFADQAYLCMRLAKLKRQLIDELEQSTDEGVSDD
jgi:hypothetical protein